MPQDTSWMDALPTVQPLPGMVMPQGAAPSAQMSSPMPSAPQGAPPGYHYESSDFGRTQTLVSNNLPQVNLPAATQAPAPTPAPDQQAEIVVGGAHDDPDAASTPTAKTDPAFSSLLARINGGAPGDQTPSAPAAGKSDTAWMDALPTVAPTPAMLMAQGKSPDGSASDGKPGGFLANVGTDLASAIEGIPRGVFGDKAVDYGNAAIGTLPGMIYGQPAGQAQPQMPMSGAPPASQGFRFMGPAAAFNQALAVSRADHADIKNAAPYSNTAGQITGALGAGMLAAPSLAYRAPAAAASLIPRVANTIGSVGSYLGRNAAFGAGTNWLAGGDPTTGAAIGGGAAAVLPVVGKALGLGARAVSKMAPLVSKGARDASVANRLARVVDPSQIESSPVGPLSLAQATNNPEVAALGDLAPGINAEANANLKAAQAGAIENQISKIAPAATHADASSTFVGAARKGRAVAGQEESRLWTAPELAQTKISPQPVQTSVNDAVAGMEPVFRNAMSPQLQGLVAEVNGASETTVRDLNGIRSRLERIARNSLDGAERSQARTLSDAFMQGMDSVPELQSDPAISAAYSTARDFTRSMRTLFADPQLTAILRKAQGVYTKDASEGARLFFNFSNGSPEGPKSIADLADFLAGLHAQPGALAISQDVRDGARAYIGAALSKAARVDGGSAFNPKLMQEFLAKNMKSIEQSGIFDKVQIEAAHDLLNYAEMLRRPEQLLQQVNSATQFRQARSKNFIDSVMSPWMRRMAELTATAGAAHMHGAVGAGVGLMASQGFEHAVAGAEDSMRQLMAASLLNSRTGRDLLMKANKNGGFLSPQTRQLLESIRLSIGSDVLPHFAVSPSSPLQVSH